MATIILRSSQSVPLTNNQVDANFNNINNQLEQVVNVTIPTLAPKASPAFSGTPTTPTASPGTNTLQVASTAFVYKELEARKSAALPAMSGIAAIGSTDRFAREDHVHPTDTTRAPVASPTFTGTATSDYFSGNGASLTNLNAGNLSTGTVPNARLTVASLENVGITSLQTAIDTSETTAATPAAVKSAYDLANAALPKSGGTMVGPIVLAGPATTDLNPVTKKQLDDAAVPQASISVAGKVELATVAEVSALTDDSRAITPSTLSEGIKSALSASGDSPVYGARAWVNFDGTLSDDVTGTYVQTGKTVTITLSSHNLRVGHYIYVDFTSGAAVDGTTIVSQVISPDVFTFEAASSINTSGSVVLKRRLIRSSANVASVTNVTTGVYAVNFTKSMPDANVALTGTASATGSTASWYVVAPMAYSRDHILFATTASSSGTNCRYVNVCVFR